jgi:5-methylcytosine-specific restriction endonuclease McrA
MGKTPEEIRAHNREKARRYRATPEGRARQDAANRKYAATTQAKEKRKTYYESDARKAATEKFKASEKYKLWWAKHYKSPEYAASRHKYLSSPKGRVTITVKNKAHLDTMTGRLYRKSIKDRRRAGEKVLPLHPAYQAEIDGMHLFCKIFPKFEVDHIIPLNGKTVSGLHVLANLQVLERSTNRSKGNKLYEEYVNG